MLHNIYFMPENEFFSIHSVRIYVFIKFNI